MNGSPSGMRRYCFRLRIRAELVAQYRARHAAVWPEMLRALRDSGWHNYSLHMDGDGLLIGYVETPDLDAALSAMALTEANTRWQESMKPFFAGDGARADESLVLLDEVFSLDDQLKRLAAHTTDDEGGTRDDI